jgi:hypothetical protein
MPFPICSATVQGSTEGKLPAPFARIENLRLGAVELSDVAALVLTLIAFLYRSRG